MSMFSSTPSNDDHESTVSNFSQFSSSSISTSTSTTSKLSSSPSHPYYSNSTFTEDNKKSNKNASQLTTITKLKVILTLLNLSIFFCMIIISITSMIYINVRKSHYEKENNELTGNNGLLYNFYEYNYVNGKVMNNGKLFLENFKENQVTIPSWSSIELKSGLIINDAININEDGIGYDCIGKCGGMNGYEVKRGTVFASDEENAIEKFVNDVKCKVDHDNVQCVKRNNEYIMLLGRKMWECEFICTIFDYETEEGGGERLVDKIKGGLIYVRFQEMTDDDDEEVINNKAIEWNKKTKWCERIKWKYDVYKKYIERPENEMEMSEFELVEYYRDVGNTRFDIQIYCTDEADIADYFQPFA